MPMSAVVVVALVLVAVVAVETVDNVVGVWIQGIRREGDTKLLEL